MTAVKTPKRHLDALDLAAEREGNARSAMREALPAVMGKRLAHQKTQTCTNYVIGRCREEHLGFGA